MIPTRRRVAAVVAAIGALAVAAPVASANAALPGAAALPALGGSPPVGLGNCASASAEWQGPTGQTQTQICQGAGLVFVAPAIGQLASVIGPTIMGPAVIGTSVVAAGQAAAG